MTYKEIIKDLTHIGKFNINKELVNYPILYRWLMPNNNMTLLSKNIYLVDSKYNRKGHLKGIFFSHIENKIQKIFSAKYPPSSCTINSLYGNLIKPYGELFFVIPIGEFTAIQSPLAKDKIDFCHMYLKENLEENNYPYHAKAFELAHKDIVVYNDLHHLDELIDKNNGKHEKRFPMSLVDLLASSYTDISKKIHHDREVLLFCDKYIIVKVPNSTKHKETSF